MPIPANKMTFIESITTAAQQLLQEAKPASSQTVPDRAEYGREPRGDKS